VGQLRLPEGAEAGFRLETADEFGPVFTMHLYGAGRRGWFLLHSRLTGPDHDPGPRPLGKGQWRTFLGLVKGCRFWELPELLPDWHQLVSGQLIMDGGGYLDLAGREGEQYHRVHRVLETEPGLRSVLRFCERLSGLFEPPAGDPLPAAPDAEPGAAADRGGIS
jgi:hypothetical protein